MASYGQTQVNAPTTLPSLTIGAIAAELGLLAAAAVVLPSVSHALGWPVRSFLPMHWPVILAGLVFGWRAGALVGVFAPMLSFLVSGMPLPHILPAMTVELGAYGLLAGLGRETFRFHPFAAAALSLVCGRVVFLLVAIATGAALPTPGAYAVAAMVPGLPAALAQLITLPLLTIFWLRAGMPKAHRT